MSAVTPGGERDMAPADGPRDVGSRAGRPAPPIPPAASPGPAWELVETGRYRPLRIRGSFPGRELG